MDTAHPPTWPPWTGPSTRWWVGSGSRDPHRPDRGRSCLLNLKTLLPKLNPGFYPVVVAQMVKCLPTMQETQVRPLGWQDPLEKAMATHSSTLAWKIPWMEEPGRLQSTGSQRVGHD